MDQTDTASTAQPDRSSQTPGRSWALPRNRAAVALAVLAAVVVAGGIWVGARSMTSVDKAGDGVRRTDITSLTERMPALAIGTTAVWYSGWMDGQNAGDEPVVTWMDAVVTLPEGRAADLAAAYSTSVDTEPPAVVDDLADDVPPGDLQTSEALDIALSTPYWHATAYLSVAEDQLVVVVEGRTTER